MRIALCCIPFLNLSSRPLGSALINLLLTFSSTRKIAKMHSFNSISYISHLLAVPCRLSIVYSDFHLLFQDSAYVFPISVLLKTFNRQCQELNLRSSACQECVPSLSFVCVKLTQPLGALNTVLSTQMGSRSSIIHSAQHLETELGLLHANYKHINLLYADSEHWSIWVRFVISHWQ